MVARLRPESRRFRRRPVIRFTGDSIVFAWNRTPLCAHALPRSTRSSDRAPADRCPDLSGLRVRRPTIKGDLGRAALGGGPRAGAAAPSRLLRSRLDTPQYRISHPSTGACAPCSRPRWSAATRSMGRRRLVPQLTSARLASEFGCPRPTEFRCPRGTWIRLPASHLDSAARVAPGFGCPRRTWIRLPASHLDSAARIVATDRIVATSWATRTATPADYARVDHARAHQHPAPGTRHPAPGTRHCRY